MNFEQTYEACIFVMMLFYDDNVSLIKNTTITNFGAEFIIAFLNENTPKIYT
jgi:spore maturation protein CgeB